ncbi:hypothetical protein JOD54_000841 [Actinokineospora baliensis]|uniref:DUF4082 domain-containing protein n=1 Tax=Actinokineospora baliensis TaxID=547056 RepID=UPI001959AC6A|nr:DUF4082 domain-containing protein [Actinokineospora baliensis]MBM7770637.1 hypothetical protein [Actinokineospora baliensis]
MSVFAPAGPVSVASNDRGGISLGTRLTAAVAGRAAGVLWFCPVGWDGSASPVYASLYSAAGVLLARTTVTGPTPGAFVTITFADPVPVEAGAEVTAAVWLPRRTAGADYAFTAGALASPRTVGQLTASTATYDYSDVAPNHPTNSTGTWFGVDVVWQPETGGGTSPIPPGYPTPATTGPQAGTVLTDYTGPTTLPPGVYTGVRFPALGQGAYESSAAGLVFRDCVFETGVVLRGDGLTVERTRVAGGLSLSGVSGAVLSRVDLHESGTDLLHVTSDTGQCANITVTDSCLRDPRPIAGAHADGVQVRGVRGLTIRRCAVDMGPWVLVEGADVLNAALFFEDANGGNSDVRVTGCWLNGGGYTLVSGAVSGDYVLTGNRWGPDGHYGPVTLATAPTLARDNRARADNALVLADTVGAEDLNLTWGRLMTGWRFEVVPW